MRYFCILFLLAPQLCFGQDNSGSATEDPFKMDISKNIFRPLLALHADAGAAGLAVLASYERELKIPFTVVAKAGPSFSREEIIINDPFDNSLYRFTINAMASAELRYYYNLKRRMRLKKTTRNFSAGYLSLEPFAISKTLLVLNRNGAEDRPGVTGVYVNIGYQKQVRRMYYNLYFGTRFPGPVYSHAVDVTDIIHAGISVGGVFE